MPKIVNKLVKRTSFLAAAVASVGVLAALVLLSCARVEMSAHGVPTRLRIPLLVGDAAFPITVGAGTRARLPGFLDGPIVRRGKDHAWSATWFCQDRAHHAQGSGDTVRIQCAGQAHAFALQEAEVPAAVAPMPARLVVLSDLEGNVAFLDQALRKLAIVDASGNWRYGAGQLVILGDSVDRGRDVFAVLWRLHALAAQASAAGGAVHVVLGNHEQYMLRGNPARANREHLYALNTMGGYREAFSGDTVIGHWLRQQPVLLKLGRVLFVHGGISPAVAQSGLSVAQLNRAMKDYWDLPPPAPHSPALDAVLAPTGVTQYRGYFKASDGRYPRAGDADVSAVLERFDARRIVVAHTLVEQVESLRGDRIFAVDVNNDEARPEVLVYENGVPRIIDIGIARNLPGRRQDVTLRDFSLGDAADRKLLVDMYRDIRRLSALPYPY